MVARPAAPLAASTPRALPSAWGSAEAKSDGDRRRWRARRSQLRHRLRRYGPGPGPIHWWGGRRLAATWAGVQRVCYFTVPFSGGAGLHDGLSIFASPDERTELSTSYQYGEIETQGLNFLDEPLFRLVRGVYSEY